MPNDIVTTGEIGCIIRQRRKELGFSQEQLSEKVGVSYQQIQRYENGGSMLNVENIQRIAIALRLPVNFFFEQHSPPPVISDPSPLYTSAEEKRLVKHFRELLDKADRQLVLGVIRKLAQRQGH